MIEVSTDLLSLCIFATAPIFTPRLLNAHLTSMVSTVANLQVLNYALRIKASTADCLLDLAMIGALPANSNVPGTDLLVIAS